MTAVVHFRSVELQKGRIQASFCVWYVADLAEASVLHVNLHIYLLYKLARDSYVANHLWRFFLRRN